MTSGKDGQGAQWVRDLVDKEQTRRADLLVGPSPAGDTRNVLLSELAGFVSLDAYLEDQVIPRSPGPGQDWAQGAGVDR